MIGSVIPDKAPTPTVKESWPRPESVPCQCGGTAWQTKKGTPQYSCLKCSTTLVCWTGFDDPAWF